MFPIPVILQELNETYMRTNQATTFNGSRQSNACKCEGAEERYPQAAMRCDKIGITGVRAVPVKHARGNETKECF